MKHFAMIATIAMIPAMSFAGTSSCFGNAVYTIGCQIGAACAPEVQQGNIQATDRILKDLSNGDLKNETTFRAVVSQISKLQPQERMSAYLKLAGVNSDNEIAEFVGSRDQSISPKYVQTLSNNTKLSSEQSQMVLQKISAGLLGGRQ